MFETILEPWEEISEQAEKLMPVIRAISYPLLPEKPEIGQFYRVYPEGDICGKGTAYHGNVRIGKNPKRLIVYFNGGGCAFDEYTTSRPWNLFTAHIKDTYYSNDGEWIGDFFLQKGLSAKREDNPFLDFSCIQLPYCNGDFHAGNGYFPYTAQDGSRREMPFHGWKNAMDTIRMAQKILPEPEEILIAGSSAGAAGVSFLAEDIIECFPACKKFTVLPDSMLINSPRWPEIMENVWHCPEHLGERVKTENFVLDNLIHLHEAYGDRVQMLYCCSPRDALLIMAQNALDGHGQITCPGDGAAFQKRLKDFCAVLKKDVLGAAFYIFEAPMDAEGYDAELTLHCALNNPQMFEHVEGQPTIAQWILDVMDGKAASYGLTLLDS